MRVTLPWPMRLRAAAAFVVWAALATGALADEHVWTSRGPTDVAWVTDVAIADGTAYAGTFNGVFRSVDGASTWQSSGLKGLWISQVLGRSGASAVYARASGDFNVTADLYATRDGGETWTNVLSNANFAAVDPAEASTVWAGLADGVIVKSVDSGSTWNVVSRRFADFYIQAMAFDTRAIYVVTYEGLFRSSDGGVSWTLTSQSPASILGGAGTLYGLSGNRFCRTVNSAETWTCSTLGAGGFIRVVEIPPDVQGAPPRLLASSDRGLLLSGDSGVTWAPLGGELGTTPWILGLAVDAASGLILAGNDRRMFRSQNLGVSWAPANTGLQSTYIRALALDPGHPSNLWAGASGYGGGAPGLFHSIDSGLSWSPVGGGSPPMVETIAIHPSDPNTILAGVAGTVFRSGDGGATWSSSRPSQYSIYALAIEPESPNRIFAALGEGLKISEDGGLTWGTTRSLAQSVYSLLFDQRQPGKVYAGSYYDFSYSYYGYYSYPQGGSIFVSVDHGANFTKTPDDLGGAVYSIVQDPFRENVLFAGTGGAGVAWSVDGGTHWQHTGSGPGTYVSVLVADPARPGHLYANTEQGVFRSVDGGHTWQAFSAGLTPTSVSTLAISPDGRRLHAGTAGGGIYDVELREAPAFPCVPSDTRLCLVGNRYALDLVAARKDEARYQPGAAHPLGDRAGYFGLPSATGDPDLPEIIVKVLGEGAFGQPGAAVFYTSLTTLPYGLTVTDTMTGEQQVYASNRESPMCGGADRAFEESAQLVQSASTAAFAKSASALEMLGGRFSVTLEAHHPRTGQTVAGQATALTDRSGFFGIPGVTGDPQFPEVVVKMVDGRGINGDFWFFYAGLTGLDYKLTVTDIVTGSVREYESPGAFCGQADINLAAN